ncbi:MAG: DUF1018 domain-containing protein [Nitrospiraceae bacterium]|nr:DUF1018 domain-containing protein [Nitrospiraceae bacterium]
MPEITPTQIKLVHIGKAQLGLSDADYRRLLKGYDAVTCKGLTYEAASALIDEMKRMGFELAGARSPRPKRPRGVTGLPSAAQREYLDALAGQIAWRVEDGFERLCAKIIKKKRPATSREASRMIECMKGMLGIKDVRRGAVSAPKQEDPF